MKINDKKGVNHYTIFAKACELSRLLRGVPHIKSHTAHCTEVTLKKCFMSLHCIFFVSGCGRSPRSIQFSFLKEHEILAMELFSMLDVEPYNKFVSGGKERYDTYYFTNHDANLIVDYLLLKHS